jgi:hypothetical protein
MYAVGSKYVHGSQLMGDGYRDEKGISAVGIPAKCKQLTSLGVVYAAHCFENACKFFGVPHDRVASTLWKHRMFEACKDVLPPGWDADLATARSEQK